VTDELTKFEIAQETKTYDARRIRKYTNNRNEPTGNVVLTFEGSLKLQPMSAGWLAQINCQHS